MYEGWLSFAGVELINNSRTLAYAAQLGIGGITCYDCCDSLASYLGDAPYTDVCTDNVPWLDPAVAASGRFAGFYGLRITGLDRSTIGRVPQPLITDGAVIGTPRRVAREITVGALALAQGDDALSYGMSWLASMLRGGVCGDDCTGDGICVLGWCPCTDGSTSDPQRSLLRAGVLDMPQPLSRRVLSSGALMSEIEFTLAAGIPHIFTPPVRLEQQVGLRAATAADHGAHAPTRAFLHAGLAGACVTDADCAQDPLCPQPAPPPPPPVPTSDCQCVLLPEVTGTIRFTGTISQFQPYVYSIIADASVSAGAARTFTVRFSGQAPQQVTSGVQPGVTVVQSAFPSQQFTGTITDNQTSLTVPVVVRTGPFGAAIPQPTVAAMTLPPVPGPVTLRASLGVTGNRLWTRITSDDAPAGRLVQVDGGTTGSIRVTTGGTEGYLTGVLDPDLLPVTFALSYTDLASGEVMNVSATVQNNMTVTPTQQDWEVPYWFTEMLPLPAATFPDAAEKTHIVEVRTGFLPMRCLTIEWFSNPLKLPCAQVAVDDCTRCGAMQVRYLPAGSTLRIDGRSQTVTLDCPGFAGVQQAGGLLTAPDGNPYSWPVFDCSTDMCVRISATERASDSAFTVYAVGRVDAI